MMESTMEIAPQLTIDQIAAFLETDNPNEFNIDINNNNNNFNDNNYNFNNNNNYTINNNNNYNTNNNNNNYSPYSDSSSSSTFFSPTQSPLSPLASSTDALYQQLKSGRLSQIPDDLSDSFLKEMFNLLFLLSTNQFDISIQRRHPVARDVGQIYLGQYFGKKGIARPKEVDPKYNTLNTVKFGGRQKQKIFDDNPLILEYIFDSPPEAYKHMVVHQFYLNKPKEKKTKIEKIEKEPHEIEGFINQKMRIFVVLPTKSASKRMISEVTSNGWQTNPQTGLVSTHSAVKVDNTVTANAFVTPHLVQLSDETTKEDITPIDPLQSLQAISELTISNFRYKEEFSDPNILNTGVMAQQIEKLIPGATTRIEGGHLDGKLGVNHTSVLYKNVSALQGLTLVVQCLVAALNSEQAKTSEKVSSSVSRIGHLLPPLPQGVSPLEILQKCNMLNPKKGDAPPLVNLDSSSVVCEFVRTTDHFYDYMENRKVPNSEEDKKQRESEKRMKPLDRWKLVDERVAALFEKKQLLSSKWEVQCRSCNAPLCVLADLHFFYVPDHKKHHLVSDNDKKWIGEPTERAIHNGAHTIAYLECEGCGDTVAKLVNNRGQGSPKREIEVDNVKFVHTTFERTEEYRDASEVLKYFSDRLCMETRFTTMQEERAAALEADKRKRESFPEFTRVFARPIARGTGKNPGRKAIMCTRNDKVTDLIEKIRIEFPDEKFEALFHNEDQVDAIDTAKYVNEVLFNDNDVFFGLLPQNELLINLRKYQKELLHQAIKSNRVVVCPTGSGKTAVAVEVDRELRKNKANFKTVMVVRDLPLSVQQYTYFQTYSNPRRVELINSDRPLLYPWSQMLETTDIVVLTAQVLLNRLVDSTAQLSAINLLILDEAHNTAKNHPFNCIMRDYYHMLPKAERPHILALTASPPAHMDLQRTKDLIRNFEQNTDSKIVLVDEYKVELRNDISIPVTIVHPIVPSKQEKAFVDLVSEAMKAIESTLKVKKVDGEDKESGEMQRDTVRGSMEYDHYSNPELKFLNSVLICFNDSMELAKKELEARRDEFTSVQKILDGIRVMGDTELTKQTLFIKTLADFKDVENFRGIVFVGTKAGGELILKAISNAGLGFLKPNLFFGHASKTGTGMNSSEQQKVIAKFNKGEVNLLIATSVAEEGLDLKSCNVVFRYDSVFSHRSLIQTRGRARQKNSKFIIFYHMQSPAEKAWRSSVMKLQNMLIAVGETELENSPFMSVPIYINMSGQVIIPDRIFPKEVIISAREDGVRNTTEAVTNEKDTEQKGEDKEKGNDKNEEAKKGEAENEADSEEEEDDEDESNEDEEDSEDEEDKSDEESDEPDSTSESKEEELVKRKRPVSPPTSSSLPPSSQSTPPFPQNPSFALKRPSLHVPNNTTVNSSNDSQAAPTIPSPVSHSAPPSNNQLQTPPSPSLSPSNPAVPPSTPSPKDARKAKPLPPIPKPSPSAFPSSPSLVDPPTPISPSSPIPSTPTSPPTPFIPSVSTPARTTPAIPSTPAPTTSTLNPAPHTPAPAPTSPSLCTPTTPATPVTPTTPTLNPTPRTPAPAPATSAPSNLSTPTVPTTPSTPSTPLTSSTPTPSPSPASKSRLNEKCQRMGVKIPTMEGRLITPTPALWEVSCTIYLKPDNTPLVFSGIDSIKKGAEYIVAQQLLDFSGDWCSSV